jgi:hypothetical protein
MVAPINLQCKLAMLRRENQKLRYENEMLQANEHAPERVETWDLSNETKKNQNIAKLSLWVKWIFVNVQGVFKIKRDSVNKSRMVTVGEKLWKNVL